MTLSMKFEIPLNLINLQVVYSDRYRKDTSLKRPYQNSSNENFTHWLSNHLPKSWPEDDHCRQTLLYSYIFFFRCLKIFCRYECLQYSFQALNLTRVILKSHEIGTKFTSLIIGDTWEI